MKKLLLLSVLIAGQLYSQTTVVEYYFKEMLPGKGISEYLIFDDKEAYYFDDVDDKYDDIKKINTDYDISRGGEKLYSDMDKKNTLFWIKGYPMSREQLLFIDNIPAINWKINKETKVILGYRCQKAAGEFRGRKYNVWFTKDIPTSFGPWKWSGLPGLILEVEDLSKSFTFTATKIVKNSEVVIPPQVKTFITNAKEENKLGDLKLYYERLEKILQEVQDRMRAKIPKDAKIVEKAPSVRDMWRERSFEWEDPKAVLKGYIKRKDE